MANSKRARIRRREKDTWGEGASRCKETQTEEMEAMREVSTIYYTKMSNEQKESVRSFFDSIDGNGDGKISPCEFSNYLRKNCNQSVPPNLFQFLDRNNDGTLDLEEIVPFHYMSKICVPVICDECCCFLWGLYFVCVECYNVCQQIYNLCRSCYRDNKFTHQHSSFLDNYALLRTKHYETGIHKVANAHYKVLPESEKQDLQKRFLDISNNIGVVSRRQYSDYITDRKFSSDLFDVVDTNGDGMLNFEEFVTLNHIHNQRGYGLCVRCSVPMLGSYFVCVKCHDADKTFDICSKCYGDKNYNHEDDHDHFTDLYGLLQLRKSKPQTIMEELVNTARVYYDTSSAEVRAAADDFFIKLDRDKDGKVNLQEYLGIMKQLGHQKLSSKSFFKELDQDGNGLLKFEEVMAVYYIIKSGRPFCCGCDVFLAGMYFTCSECFDNSDDPFSVCQKCFENGEFSHDQHGQCFLDNYALLEAKRIQHKKESIAVIVPPRLNWEQIKYNACDVAVRAAVFALQNLEEAVQRGMRIECPIM